MKSVACITDFSGRSSNKQIKLQQRRALPKRQPAPNRKATTLSPKRREQTIIEFQEKAVKMAHSILRAWGVRLPLDEIASIANLSLCEATKTFSPTRGVSFITYFFYYLKGNLCKAIRASRKHTPIAATEERKQELLEDENARYGGLAAIDTPHCETPEESMLTQERANIGLTALYRLKNREREIVERIYLHDEYVTDVAKEMGLSRGHVTRLRNAALSKLHRFVQQERVAASN